MCFGILGDDLGNGRTPWSVNMSLHDSNARAILRNIPVPRAYHGHLVLLREGPKRGHLRRWGWSEMAGGLGYAPCRLACGCGRDCRHDYQYSSSQATVVTKQRKKGGEREAVPCYVHRGKPKDKRRGRGKGKDSMCPAAGQSSKCFRRIAARQFTADARGIVEDEQRVLLEPFGAFAARNEVRGQKAEAEAETRKMRAPSRISLS
jgi:hypothetical protein